MHYITFLQDALNEINGTESLLKHMNFLGKHGSEHFTVWLEYLDMVGLLLNFLSAESTIVPMIIENISSGELIT